MNVSTRRPRLAPLALGALLLAVPLLGGCGGDEVAEDAAASSPSASSSASPSASDSVTPSPTDPVSTTAATDPAPTATPTIPADAPDCSSVWTAGGTIPKRYKGCVEAGAYVKSDVLGCSSGQRIIRYADRFYGVAGGTVSETTTKLIRDPGYRDTVSGCRG